MSEQQPPVPGPGWWVGGDGQLYPPEAHPDYQPPASPQWPSAPPYARPGEPAWTGSAAAPLASTSPRSSGSKKIPLIVGASLLVALLLGTASYFWATSLPSVEEDTKHLEAAMPQGTDLPPGLTVQDNESSSSDSSGSGSQFCSKAVRAPGERASASVGYTSTEVDVGGLFVGAISYTDEDEASRAFLTAPAAMSCGKNRLELTPVTGAPKHSDESQAYSASVIGRSFSVVVARRGRYLVFGRAKSAKEAIQWTELALSRL